MAPKKNPWSPPEVTMPHRPTEPEMPLPLGEEEPTATHEIQVDIPRQRRRHALEQIRGPGSPRQVHLEFDEMVVGRSPECQIRVESTEVSRHHIKLVLRGEEFAVEDLGSRNGLYLNGLRVHTAVLRNEDQIQVGDAVFVYREGS
jgi:hypothetical protein